ncbi:MAG: sensor histidine kinase [Desulfovibrio sp.]|nr:sensor histidine kinase [Desulfovibrio sp.]
MNSSDETTRASGGPDPLQTVRARIKDKITDYESYAFTTVQSRAFNIFFDLAQEFYEVREVYALAPLVLRTMFAYEAEFYVHGSGNLFHPVLSEQGKEGVLPNPGILAHISRQTRADGFCLTPVFDRSKLEDLLRPFAESKPAPAGPRPNLPGQEEENILGVLIVREKETLPEEDLFFLQKYANRLGFCLHNMLMAVRDARHLLFLRKLASDIGHNIITPNIRLKRQMNILKTKLENMKSCLDNLNVSDQAALHDLRILRSSVAEQFEEINAGFSNGALFMESLLRQSHFDLGRYVLRNMRLNLGEMVVSPQFERYRPHFAEHAVIAAPDQPVLPSYPCFVRADHGLISQVLANLLSNAAKYAAPAPGSDVAEVRCLLEKSDGEAKVTVFTSGAHIAPDDAGRLFEDNFRASNSSGRQGTGHGLFFVREIIAAHRGKVGYEPAPGGNNFYFLLPLEQDGGKA